jgi:hypothetical protein
MGTKTQKLSNVVDQIVEWQSVVVADGSTNTTGVSGRGYFVDTSAGAHTVNLPASPKIGDVIKVSLITAGNDLTIGRNGNNINGATSDLITSVDGDTFELVYVNASEGWKTVSQITAGIFTSATGGTVTESGDYKIHTFTGDGCFVVCAVGNGASVADGGPAVVDYLVVAGGGSGAMRGGGGGAGGYRESSGAASGCYTASPLGSGVPALTVSATTYPVTVGGGGASVGPSPNADGNNGSNSVFSTITSAGGGFGGGFGLPPSKVGGPGGSGGGAPSNDNGNPAVPAVPITGKGTGNTPPVSPPQGSDGGLGTNGWYYSGGGGGGATSVGGNGAGGPAQPSSVGGPGGNGATSSINGTPTTRAGGGGANGIQVAGTGGPGGGGAGSTNSSGTNGTDNTGGGGGGTQSAPNISGAGGKGIVIIRYKYQ